MVRVDAGVDDGDIDVCLVVDAVDRGVGVLVRADARDAHREGLVGQGDELVALDGDDERVVVETIRDFV